MATSAVGNNAPIKLWNNKKEKDDTENKAEFFALIKTVDRLEKAFMRDHIRYESFAKLITN
jgi:ESCRT-I complex subunit VPS28